MVIDMDETRLQTISQLHAFQSRPVAFNDVVFAVIGAKALGHEAMWKLHKHCRP
jgi:hypothetical protein